MLAHLTCRTPLSVCLSPIPAAKTLLVFAGLKSLLPCDHWHLSTALSAAWTRQVIQFIQGHMSFATCSFFLCLPLAPKCGHIAMIRMGGTSYGRVQLRCFSAPLWNLSWCDFWPTLDSARPRLLRPERLVFIQDQGYTPCPGSYAARVAIAWQDKWRKHSLQHRLLAIYAFLASWQAY